MELMTITEMEPIYVTFSVPEAQLTDIKKYMAQGKLSVYASPQDNAVHQEAGVLTFIDNSVDSTTGTIKLKGTFQNADKQLWPGQFVRVTLRLTTRPNAVVIPNQAIQNGQDGQFVYVVKDDMRVEMRPVVTSTRVDQDLVGGQRACGPVRTIVTEGQLRLAPNTPEKQASGSGAQRRAGQSQLDRSRGARTLRAAFALITDTLPGLNYQRRLYVHVLELHRKNFGRNNMHPTGLYNATIVSVRIPRL